VHAFEIRTVTAFSASDETRNVQFGRLSRRVLSPSCPTRVEVCITVAVTAFNAAQNDWFPDSAAYHGLASVYASQSQFGQANDEIKSGLLDVPNDPYLLGSGIFFSLVTREDTEAARRFELLQRLYAGSREALSAGCLYYYGIGQPSSALPFCAQLTAQFPKDRIAHSNYGWAALDAKQSQLAYTEFSTPLISPHPSWTNSQKHRLSTCYGDARCPSTTPAIRRMQAR